MRRRLAAAAAAVALLTTAGCTGLEGTEGKEYVGADFQTLELTPGERAEPIESRGTTIDGAPIDVADYRGQVLVVNVWWSGCGPCRKELPLLVDAVGSLGSDVSLVGINTRDASAASAASFERGLGVDFPSFYDPGGERLLDYGDDVNPRAIPSTVVLDREGRVAALISGAIPTEQTLLSVIEPVVAEGSGSADG